MSKTNGNDYINQDRATLQFGLTKREYFAAMALQGLLARDYRSIKPAVFAVEYADMLIAELNKQKKPKE